MGSVLAVAITLFGGLMDDPAQDKPAAPGPRARITVDSVARLPYPGTVVPGAIQFTRDSKSLTYLKSNENSLERVLWRASVSDHPMPRVIASAPGGGDTDTTVSKEEQLRRERQRLRETGITQAVHADDRDVTIFPIGGDVYAQEDAGPLRRLTETAVPEIDPRPSPDGRSVAFVRDGHLFRLEIASLKETQLSTEAADGLSNGLAEFMAQEELGRSTGFWWSPDSSHVAYQQTDERNVPLYTITHQGDPNYSAETHRYPFAGRENASVRLGVVPATGGATTWLKFAEPSEDVYLARVEWDGPGHLLVQVLPRDQKSLRLIRIDISTGERRTLLEETSDSFVNLHDDLRLLPETGDFIWSSERTGYRHLELRSKDGAFLKPLTSGDWPVDSVVGLDRKRREVWFSSGRGSPRETHLFRVSIDDGEIVDVSKESGTHKAVVSNDGDYYVDIHSSLKSPPTTSLHRRDGTRLALLDDAGTDPRLAEWELPSPRLTEFRNRQGVVLHGAYYPPRGVVLEKRAPLIVMVYGGPHVQNVTDSWTLTADLTAQFLAERGFGVWKLDNRGSARRGVAFESALYRRMGELEVEDQVDGVRFLSASQPEIDPNRVGITGGSYGGYMTIRCLELAPDVFHAGVAVAPVTDWDGYDTAYTERYMGTPGNNPSGYRASSALSLADRLKGDLLIIHGMIDENVHFRHSARLATALIAAGKPFELLPIPSERHSSRKIPERKFLANRMVDFFERTLKSPHPTAP